MGFQLLENAIVVRVLVDVETDRDGAAIEGDWVSLRDYDECTILIQAGALGADIVWQIEQATTNTGTSKKDSESYQRNGRRSAQDSSSSW